jgi:hypothetical protein
MFFITLPKSFKIGDTVDCRINQEPARVTWRDPDHLVIEPDDARLILGIDKDSESIAFACGDAGANHDEYESEMLPGGSIISHKR